MKIIVLTHPEFLPDEAEALTCLLDKGLDRLHLRKPGCSEAQLEALIRQLPTEYYKRILAGTLPFGRHPSEQS